MNLEFLTLRTVPQFIPEIASIYFIEWGWHFEDEWDINTLAGIQSDLEAHYLDHTYVLCTHDKKEMIGTVAILPDDLLSHSYLSPWMTCLYVKPKYRERNYGSYLLECIKRQYPDRLYLWCIDTKLVEWYAGRGWNLHEVAFYKNLPAYIMYI